MGVLFNIIIASVLVSLVSLIGAVLFIAKEKKIQRYMILFVALAAGTLLGTAFLELIPESFHMFEELGSHGDEGMPSMFILLGILVFYFIEKIVRWHHHHDLECTHHHLTTLSLVGDGFHNLIDGILIATAFMVDTNVGIITTLAILLHEVPQEIGDLSILLHGGFGKMKALLWNFLSGLVSLFGAILTYIFLQGATNFIPLLTAFTAGGFIYISLADIIPELHKGNHGFNRNTVSLVFFSGIVIIYLLTQVISH